MEQLSGHLVVLQALLQRVGAVNAVCVVLGHSVTSKLEHSQGNRDDQPGDALYNVDAPGTYVDSLTILPYHQAKRLRANFKLWGAVQWNRK